MNELNYSEKLFLCLMNKKGGFSMLREYPVKLSLFSSCVLELIELKHFEFDNELLVIRCTERYNGTDERLKNAFNSIIVYKTKRYKLLLKGFLMHKKNFQYLYRVSGINLLHKGYVSNENNYDVFFPYAEKQKKVIEDIKPFVLGGDKAITKDDAIFMLFMQKCKLLNIYFTKAEIKTIDLYLDEIKNGTNPVIDSKILDAFNGLTECYGSVVL